MSVARASVLAALAVFALHTALLLTVPQDREFFKYPAAARQQIHGELPAERLVDFSPLYLEVHRRMILLVGDPQVMAEASAEDRRPHAAVRWLQLVAVSLAVAMVFALLYRRFSPWLAIALLVVLALDRHLLIYARILEPEAFLLAAVVAFVVALSGRRPGVRQALLAGLAGAVALGLRPSVLPLLAAGLLVLALLRPPRRRRALAVVVFAVPLAAALVLLGLRADRATGDSSTPFMNPGTVFFEGNNPLSRGTSTVYPPVVMRLSRYLQDRTPDSGHVHYRHVARASAGAELTVREVNAFWGQRAGRFLWDHPAHALRLAAQKLAHAFHAHRWHDVPSAFGIELSLRPPTFPFALLSALGLVGLLVGARRWRSHLLFYAVAAAQLAVMVVFYVSARQRVLLLPALVWFAAVTVRRLARPGRGRVLLAILVLALAVALSVPTAAVVDHRQEELAEHSASGLAAEIRSRLAAGEPTAALRPLFLALGALRPWWYEPPAYFPQDQASYAQQLADFVAADPRASPHVRATAALRAGRLDVAEELFHGLAERGERRYERAAQGADPRFYLGRIAALRGDREAAIEQLEAALAASPGDPFILAELVAVGGGASAQEAARRYWSDLDYQLLLGEALLVHGRAEEAVAALGFVVRRLPELRLARLRLAEGLARVGRDDEAVAAFAAAQRQGMEPAWGGDAIVPLFERWLADRPADPDARLLAVRVFHLYGRYRLAAATLDEAGGSPTPALAAERRRVALALEALERDGRLP